MDHKNLLKEKTDSRKIMNDCLKEKTEDEIMEETQQKKFGIVMEGGGMRGLYTAGVIDVLMENDIYADSAIGVSAGAVFGCNYKSRQIGRVLRYNKKYCKDKRLASVRNWITTGDVYSKEFGYNELPWKLDIFDRDTYSKAPMHFTVVCTDLDTGKPVYHECPNGDVEDIEWMRASASIPVASRPVKLAGKKLLDGGVSDPIPVDWMLAQGYEKVVVVLTRDAQYRKSANPKLQLFLKLVLHKYPAFLKDLEERHIHYNETLDKLASLEKEGRVHIIRPSQPVKAAMIERDENNLERIYQTGRKDMKMDLDKLTSYLKA